MQTAVIVLAAGAGTRMKSKTPKVLHTLAGRSMLAHSLHAATSLNPTHLVTVVGHDRERVTEAVNAVAGELDRSVTVAVQDEQKGTGHAVSCGLEGLPADFSGTVLVTAADVPLLDGKTIADLLAQHTAAPAAAVTVLTSTAVDPTGYGRILRTTDGEVNAIVEEKEATDSQRSITEVNSGVYAFDFETLRDALASLDSNNAQHEFYLTDVIMIARRAGKRVRAQHIADSVLVAGANDRVQLSTLAREMNRRILEKWMRAGVTVVDPASTWIDCDVRIAQDVTLLPGVQLTGTTSVGEDAVIGPDTTLDNVRVGERAVVVRSHGTDSVVGADRDCRPLRLSPAWYPPRGTRQDRRLRGNQERGYRRAFEDSASYLRRRRHHRPSQQYRSFERLRQLRRGEQEPYCGGVACPNRLRHHVRRPSRRGRRRIHGCGHGLEERRTAWGARRLGWGAAQHRGLGPEESSRHSRGRCRCSSCTT